MVQSQLPTLSFATAWKPKRRHTKEQHLKWRGFRLWCYLFRPRSLLHFCYCFLATRVFAMLTLPCLWIIKQNSIESTICLETRRLWMLAMWSVICCMNEVMTEVVKIIFWGRQPSIFLICMACTICVKPLNTCPVSTTYIFAEAVRSINDTPR